MSVCNTTSLVQCTTRITPRPMFRPMRPRPMLRDVIQNIPAHTTKAPTQSRARTHMKTNMPLPIIVHHVDSQPIPSPTHPELGQCAPPVTDTVLHSLVHSSAYVCSNLDPRPMKNSQSDGHGQVERGESNQVPVRLKNGVPAKIQGATIFNGVRPATEDDKHDQQPVVGQN